MSEPPAFQPQHPRRRPTGDQAHTVDHSGTPQRRSLRPQLDGAQQASVELPGSPNLPEGSQFSGHTAPGKRTADASAPPGFAPPSASTTPPPSFAPRRLRPEGLESQPRVVPHYRPAAQPYPNGQQHYAGTQRSYPSTRGQSQAPQSAFGRPDPYTGQPQVGGQQFSVNERRRYPGTQPQPQPPAFYPHSRGVPTPPPQVAFSQPPASPPRQPFRLPKKRHWGRRFFIFLLVMILAIAAWATFLITDANRHLGRTDALGQTSSSDGTTYLIAGSDSRADGSVQDNTEGQRADSIMVVNVAPNGQASAISIPRDTYVEIPEYGWNKINASYSFGGDALLVTTVEHLTGLTVDHYVEVGMGGVADIVDAVGGVNLCYDQTVSDQLSGLNWEAGCHNADGTTALAFSRMRYSDPLGDIGRAERQRQVVTKAVSKALSPATLINPVSAFRLERAGSEALTVDQDSSVLDIGRLALAFKQASGDGLIGAPPIESLGYATNAGSAVLLKETTAPDFFTKLKSGQLATSDFASLGQ